MVLLPLHQVRMQCVGIAALMITPDSTLREIAAAAHEVGFRLTITPAPLPTRADRLTAQYGPRGHCWEWAGPWKRVMVARGASEDIKEMGAWERCYTVPDYDMEGNAIWDRRWRGTHLICLYDEPLPGWDW